MRLDPELVHPSIFKATDGLLWSGQYGVSTDPKSAKAWNEHQSIWFREYGKGFLIYMAFAVAMIVTTINVGHGMAMPWKLLFVLGMILGTLGTGLFAYRRNLRSMTAPELDALLPVLELSDAQRTYAETLVALDRSGRPKAEVDDAMRALNALLDEDARLAAAREAIGGTGERFDRAKLGAERARLADRAAAARDPEARSTFESSVALLDERIANLDGLGAILERLDAQQELLRQALLTTRDAALHRGVVPAPPNLGACALRAAVGRARAQAQETERALAELNAA